MSRYLIEVKHEDDHDACVRALHALQSYGSHLITHADWGCRDNVHACWLIVDVDTREEAMAIVHPEFRNNTRVVSLNSFTREDIQAMAAELDKDRS